MFEDVSIEQRCDNIKSKLIEYADGEKDFQDQELNEYNEYLINSIEIIYNYILALEDENTTLEKKINK